VCSRIKETVDLVRARLGGLSGEKQLLGLILGSGLGAFADSFQNQIVIPFSDLPNFPSPTVPGHSGNLVAGYAEGVPVVAVQGRVHLYEGYSIEEVAVPARVLGLLGIGRLIVTNAAGGINPMFHPGDLMLITDHINMMGTNPLIGPNMDEAGPRFPDMSEAYDPGMRDITLEAAKREKITLRQGVYLGLPGPSYETPAEIRMCRILGADVVGMSTIPEVVIANQMGMRVLGISCITNMAAGILPQKLAHKEVIDTAEKASGKLQSLLGAILPRLTDAHRNR
jgi:purine-nucleoside phosphorylase